MSFSSSTDVIKRKAQAFTIIGDEDFFVDDWLQRNNDDVQERPIVIASAFSDNGQRFVVIRDETFKRTIYSLEEFTQKINDREWLRLPKPKFQVGQVFKNKYTEHTYRIVDVPYAPNDLNGEYMYFVRSFSPTSGRNFTILSEIELDDFIKHEGVDSP